VSFSFTRQELRALAFNMPGDCREDIDRPSMAGMTNHQKTKITLVLTAAALCVLANFTARWAAAAAPGQRQKWLRYSADAKGAARWLVAFASALPND
jgi:hypothetical protein